MRMLLITLYYAPDNASLIIRIILEELGLPYDTVLVDRSKQEQLSDAYAKLNPKRLIPVCLINGKPVFETAAIALALADRHCPGQGARLAPEVADNARPQFLKWLFFLSNTLHPDLRMLFYAEKYVGHSTNAIDSIRACTRQRLYESFAILDAHYAGLGTDYLQGDTPCIVDIYIAVCMRWAQLYPANATEHLKCAQYPVLSRLLQRLELRPAVISACQAEGITQQFFSNPDYANPPEGSAT